MRTGLFLYRNTDCARRAPLRSNRFWTNAVVGPFPFQRDSPLAEPSDDEALPALRKDLKRPSTRGLGGTISGDRILPPDSSSDSSKSRPPQVDAMAQQSAQGVPALLGDAAALREGFSPSPFTSPTKRLPDRAAKGAPPTCRERKDVRRR